MKIADSAELERYALLAEEMGEALQVIGKILRHGTESVDPTDPNAVTNRKLLENELAHVEVATELLINVGDIDHKEMRRHKHQKWVNLQHWLHHAKNIGVAERRGDDTVEVPDAD